MANNVINRRTSAAEDFLAEGGELRSWDRRQRYIGGEQQLGVFETS